MINHPSFSIEPWCLRATELDLELLGQIESVFALSNGHIGWRANLDEGEPHWLPGSYLNGVHELRTLPYAEPGYGYPESGQTIINVTNGKVIRLLVDDEPFDVTYGRVDAHEWRLDFRDGVLRRRTDWTSPAGCAVRVSSTRLVSLVHRSIGAIRYQVEAIDRPMRVVVQSELVANEALPAPTGDPRAGPADTAPLIGEKHAAKGARAGLVHSTARSELRIAAVMDHVVDGPANTVVESETFPDLGRVTVTAKLEPGQALRLDKFVAYGWSATRSLPAVWDQADAALAGARQTGLDGLLRRTTRLPRRLLGSRRCRTRRGSRNPTGRAVLAVPRAAGRRSRGGPRDPRERTHRPRLQRTQLLGHRSLRVAGADPGRPRCRRPRAALAPLHPADGHRTRHPARARRCRLPVAHHPRRRMLQLLARGHRCVSHQRRHRRRRHPLPRHHRRSGLRPRRRR